MGLIKDHRPVLVGIHAIPYRVVGKALKRIARQWIHRLREPVKRVVGVVVASVSVHLRLPVARPLCETARLKQNAAANLRGEEGYGIFSPH